MVPLNKNSSYFNSSNLTFTYVHTDPVCEFFSKNYLMAKMLQNNSNLNLKVRKIEKRPKKIL